MIKADALTKRYGGLTAISGVSFEVVQYRAEIERALAEMDEFLTELIEARRRQPQDDLLTRLVEAHDGDDRLDHDELLAMVSMLLVAGTDTTRHQLGCAVARGRGECRQCPA